jgi:NADH dehydrogenase [ubiquinone] 1 alpha subcomplex assembly factor 5
MLSTTIRQLTRQSHVIKRQYVATPQAFHVFNRDVKRMQKDRAASKVEESRTVDYLKDEIAARVADRLLVITGKRKGRHCLIGFLM